MAGCKHNKYDCDKCTVSVLVPAPVATVLRNSFPKSNWSLISRDIHTVTTTIVEKRDGTKVRVSMDSPSIFIQSDETVEEEEIGNLEVLESGKGDVESIPQIPSTDSLAMHDLVPNMDLAAFLSRPVLINTYDWTTSGSYGPLTSFKPWHLFMSHAQIQYKLHNYAFIRGKLRLKFMINSSPFFAGCLLYSYRPLTGFNSETIDTAAVTGQDVMQYTQRPHVFLYPQNSQGAELELPFFYYKNWLQLGNTTEIQNFGSITPFILNTLTGANGQTGTVTVQIFASLIDPQVSAPTYNLAVQGDEYEENPVSKPATVVAEAAGILAKIPYIRPFALATEYGARTVARVGKALGYSVVPYVGEVKSWKQVCAPPLAASDHQYPYERLSLDPKQGLSVDPSLHGLPPIDELAIQNLVTKRCFLTTVTWNVSDADDTVKLNLACVPWHMISAAITGGHQYSTSPGAFVAKFFKYWRGDIKFTFKVICTKFHRGRLRFTYDPQADISAQTDTVTSSITKIVDIGTTTDFSIVIPYTQAYPMLKTVDFDSSVATFQTSGFSNLHAEGYSNGQMTMRVFNRLLAPTTSGSVAVNVFFECLPNMEFMAPGSVAAPMNQPTRYVIQSYEGVENEEELVMGQSSPIPHPERFKLVGGEVITSLRQVASRLNFNYCDMAASTTGPFSANSHLRLRIARSRLPPQFGYDTTGGMHIAASSTGGSNTGFNYCSFAPIPYLLPAFVGWRGSINWHIMVSNVGRISYLTANRYPGGNLGMLDDNTAHGGPYTSTSQAAYNILNDSWSGFPGSSVTSQVNQSTISFNVPHYSQFRFDSTDPSTYNTGSSIGSTTDGRNSNFVVTAELNPLSESVTLPSVKIMLHSGAGPDFLPLFFLNTPTMYTLTSIPAPV